jgi:hypothetical protein
MIEFKITNEKVYNNRPLLSLEDKTKWIEALKSGKYQKGKLYLSKENKYCCLGILCEIENLPKIKIDTTIKYGKYLRDTAGLPKDSKLFSILNDDGRFVGFEINGEKSLVGLNDCTETFDKIIKVIEKYF